MQSGLKYIKSITSDSVWDIALREYGSINAVFDIIENNPALTLDTNIAANINIVIDTTFIPGAESFDESNITVTPQAKGFVTVLTDQSIWDIVLQEYGTIEPVFEFLSLNGLSAEDNLIIGRRYKLPLNDGEKHIKEYYQKSEIKVVSGIIALNYLRREDGGYELREDGGRIILED